MVEGLFRDPTKKIVCTYYSGSKEGNLGTPHRIFVTNFGMIANTDGKIRFLISNPDGLAQSPLRVGVKGYGGSGGNIFS